MTIGDSMHPRSRFLTITVGLFAASVAFSLLGMLALKLAPGIATVFGPYLPQLMRWPTWVYVVTLPLAVFAAFLPRLGWPVSLWLAAYGTLVGATAELIGTATGFPFGHYSYSDFLGAKILGRVPYAIPPSWYAASLLSFAFASALGLTRFRRILLAAVFLVMWDLALDPAMSAGFPVWLWGDTGPFYGTPWTNFAGWFGTGLVIMAGFELAFRGQGPGRDPWPGRIWLVNGVFAVGISAISGLLLGTIVGAAAIALPLLLVRFLAPPAAAGAPGTSG